MIPHGLMTCYISTSQCAKREVRVLDCGVDSCVFRLAKAETPVNGMFRVVFFMIAENRTVTVDVYDAAIELCEVNAWWKEYRMETRNARFRESMKAFMKQYTDYMETRSAGDTRAIAEEADGAYPREEEYFDSIEEARTVWSAEAELPEGWKDAKEIGVALGDSETVQLYLTHPLGTFFEAYCAAHRFERHPIRQARINCLYVGSSYCEHLLPQADILESILRKARTEGLHVVLVLPPVRESSFDRITSLIEKAVDYGVTEICVNDWGTLEYLRRERFSGVRKTLGILLCKRRKDARLERFTDRYQLPKYTSTDDSMFKQWIGDRYGSLRFSYEAGTNADIGDDGIVHWPLTQLNTSEYCDLRAAVENGDRARQSPADSCKGYCSEHYFFYPKRLNTMGKYNTLFGKVKCEISGTIDRLVIDLL